MVLKIPFTTLGDLLLMVLFFTHVRKCVMRATPMLNARRKCVGTKELVTIGGMIVLLRPI